MSAHVSSGGDALISEKRVPTNVGEWQIKDVEKWLDACGLGAVKPLFRNHEVCNTCANPASQQCLKMVGVLNPLATSFSFP